MGKLTDAMIMSDLKNTVFMGNENTLVIVIMVIATIVLGAIFFCSKSTRQKIGSGGTLILLLVLCFALIGQNNSMKNSINSGNWFVHTDTVDRVMQETDSDGDVSYFMVLKKYGRVSLDSYSEASQYYAGAKVYVVVVPEGSGYEDTGVTYPTDFYTYVGNH